MYICKHLSSILSLSLPHSPTLAHTHTLSSPPPHTLSPTHTLSLQDLAQGKEYGPSIACLALLCGFTILLWHIQQLKAAATGQTTTYTTTPVVRTAIASKRGRKGGRGEGDPQQQQGALVRAVTDMRAAFVMHAVDIAEHTKVRKEWGCGWRGCIGLLMEWYIDFHIHTFVPADDDKMCL